jgi:hypothetical protein
MPRHSQGGRRDLGLKGGAGKGDAPRYKHDENWRTNFEEIAFPASDYDGFVQVHPGKKVKRYGVAEPTPDAKAPHIKL